MCVCVCVCVCKQELALNNPYGLICHKTQPTMNLEFRDMKLMAQGFLILFLIVKGWF